MSHVVASTPTSAVRRRVSSSSTVLSSSGCAAEPEQLRREPIRAAIQAGFELAEESRALVGVRGGGHAVQISRAEASASVMHMVKRNAGRVQGSVRIIAGEWRGRRIAIPERHERSADAGPRARDRVQLVARLARGRALSRSCTPVPACWGSRLCRAARRTAWFVEQDAALVEALNATGRQLGATPQIVRRDALAFLREARVDTLRRGVPRPALCGAARSVARAPASLARAAGAGLRRATAQRRPARGARSSVVEAKLRGGGRVRTPTLR